MKKKVILLLSVLIITFTLFIDLGRPTVIAFGDNKWLPLKQSSYSWNGVEASHPHPDYFIKNNEYTAKEIAPESEISIHFKKNPNEIYYLIQNVQTGKYLEPNIAINKIIAPKEPGLYWIQVTGYWEKGSSTKIAFIEVK